MFVIGTAGHIDHGKSVLVHALTGIDPDRLPEEKERGMTIDLGFAWLKLPSGREVGIVDVPGHERLIKNMLAGVGGIDLALLIVAANEGVMAQTKEHLGILDLLGVQRGIIVITKKDLVDEEWLSMVTIDIEELIKPTSLCQAPIVAVSAVTGDGLPHLISTIDQLLSSTQPRKDIGRPRLPIDRVFTIAGSGTVVTGTLIDGSLSLRQEVEIVPPGLKLRLRGLQTHKTRIDTASPGSRVAANLAGVATSQLKRGDVLTTPGWLVPTKMLSIKLRLLPYLSHPLGHNTTISFHTGTTEVMAKVRLLEKERLEAGETTWAQLKLANPVAVTKGDHFIIRSPNETLGGGDIIEAHAKQYRRYHSAIIQSLEAKERGTTQETIMATLETKQPLDLRALFTRCDLPTSEAQLATESLIQQKRVIGIGEGERRLFFTTPGWERWREKVIAIVQEYHRRLPARPGMPKGELSNRLRLTSRSATSILQRLSEEGVLIEDEAVIRLTSHRMRLTQEQQAKIDAFLKSLAQNPYSPPGDLIPEPDLLNLLIKQHQVVKVSEDVVFAASTYDEMVKKTIAYAQTHGVLTLPEVRDLFNTSRKYARAFLDYLDQQKITRRIGDKRVLP